MEVPKNSKDKKDNLETNSQQVALITKEQVNEVDIYKFQSMDALFDFAAKISKSNLCPLKKVEDVVIAITTGKELGFPMMASLNNIYNIEDKGTLSWQFVSALLIKAKVPYDIIKDYEALHAFADKNKQLYDWDFVFNNPEKFQIFSTGDKVVEGKIQVKPVKTGDFVTEVKFIRQMLMPDGTYYTRTHIERTKLSEMALAQGGTLKNQWINRPSQMLRKHTIISGARIIAPDALQGTYEVTEILDAKGIKYTEDAETGRIVTNVEATEFEEHED